jgi:lipoic acid synthetase
MRDTEAQTNPSLAQGVTPDHAPSGLCEPPTTVAIRGPAARRPKWLRVRVDESASHAEVRALLSGLSLNTVCTEARCPNIWECWGKHRTATFMIMGATCTRACRYCSVAPGKPLPLDPQEPARVAEAASRLKLAHAVITSVTRDDLADGGALHFADTVRAVRARVGCPVEVLVPDFGGSAAALEVLLAARPEVVGHNVETVPSKFSTLRPRGDYARSLALLQRADDYRRAHGLRFATKSGLMVGLGETEAELLAVMRDLRAVHCDILTLGQYLNPTAQHAPIARFYSPQEFATLKEAAMAQGFVHCESGPLVRSSYHAGTYAPASTDR